MIRTIRPRPNVCRLVLALFVTGVLSSCITTHELRMREYSKNIVIDATDAVFIQETRSSVNDVVADLRARGIADNAYIVLHVHRKASAQIFEKVSATLQDEGYEHVTYEMYDD